MGEEGGRFPEHMKKAASNLLAEDLREQIVGSRQSSAFPPPPGVPLIHWTIRLR
jgi:hypothetical protein